MPNPSVTNVDIGSVALEDARYDDDIFVAAGAITLEEGTVLGRVTASGKLYLFDKSASDGTEVPIKVMGYKKVIEAAGDIPVRPILSGGVKKDRLIIAAGGDTTVDDVVVDQLKDSSIVAQTVTEQLILDNQ